MYIKNPISFHDFTPYFIFEEKNARNNLQTKEVPRELIINPLLESNQNINDFYYLFTSTSTPLQKKRNKKVVVCYQIIEQFLQDFIEVSFKY